MFRLISIWLIWLVCGIIGSSGMNAKYQYDPDWWEDGCYVQSRRHLTKELKIFVPLILGPFNLIAASINTGLFDSGLSFHFGIPKRCNWAHNK